MLYSRFDSSEHTSYEMDFPPHYYQMAMLDDMQLAFRILAIKMQNQGDFLGRFTALGEYDYGTLMKWFYILDSMDEQSCFLPAMATYYYSHTQKTEDVYHIVSYLSHYGMRNLDKQWWWIVQAILLSKNILNDQTLALELSSKLFDSAEVPVWTRELYPILSANLGDRRKATSLFRQILDNKDAITPYDAKQMEFLMERLGL